MDTTFKLLLFVKTQIQFISMIYNHEKVVSEDFSFRVSNQQPKLSRELESCGLDVPPTDTWTLFCDGTYHMNKFTKEEFLFNKNM